MGTDAADQICTRAAATSASRTPCRCDSIFSLCPTGTPKSDFRKIEYCLGQLATNEPNQQTHAPGISVNTLLIAAMMSPAMAKWEAIDEI